MGKFVHVTADRVRSGMRGLEKITEKDGFPAEREALEEAERRLREDWERKNAKAEGETERGG